MRNHGETVGIASSPKKGGLRAENNTNELEQQPKKRREEDNEEAD
jgi:hypothetical protein